MITQFVLVTILCVALNANIVEPDNGNFSVSVIEGSDLKGSELNHVNISTSISEGGSNSKVIELDNAQFSESISEGSKSTVIELDDASFLSIEGSSTDLWFVMFYQPWCGYCHKMAPEWNQASSEIQSNLESKDQAAKIYFSQLDCGRSPETCNRLGIFGYPQLILFVNGTMYGFPRDQQRTAENFVKFVKSGYLEQPSMPIPSGISWIESFRKELENIWYNSKFILLRYPEVASCFVALGTFVGIATTSLAFMMATTTPNHDKLKRQ